MQRALWSGAISFGLVHIPVELFSAEKRSALDLTMLDRRDFAPIGYKKFNKQTHAEVAQEDIVKGYEYDTDQFVVLSDEELKKANVKATQTIDILGFVDATEVALTSYDQPYFLSPAKGGNKVYALLRETLRRAGKIGIAQIVLRTKQHLVALWPMENAIVLNTLRYDDEIRSIDDLKLPESDLKKVGVSEKEILMALSLVEGMSEPWNPAQYRDTYRDDVLAMIDRKVKAHQTHASAVSDQPDNEELPAGANIVDLMALLKRSLAVKGKDGEVLAPATVTRISTARKTTPKSVAKKAAPKASGKPVAVVKAATARAPRKRA